MDDSGENIELEQVCPWKEHLQDLEEKLSLPKSCIKFVIYKEIETDKWRVQVKREAERKEATGVEVEKKWGGGVLYI